MFSIINTQTKLIIHKTVEPINIGTPKRRIIGCLMSYSFHDPPGFLVDIYTTKITESVGLSVCPAILGVWKRDTMRSLRQRGW